MAKMGFDATVVNFTPGVVEKARENAARRWVRIVGFVQEISILDAPLGIPGCRLAPRGHVLPRSHARKARGDAETNSKRSETGRLFQMGRVASTG